MFYFSGEANILNSFHFKMRKYPQTPFFCLFVAPSLKCARIMKKQLKICFCSNLKFIEKWNLINISSSLSIFNVFSGSKYWMATILVQLTLLSLTRFILQNSYKPALLCILVFQCCMEYFRVIFRKKSAKRYFC